MPLIDVADMCFAVNADVVSAASETEMSPHPSTCSSGQQHARHIGNKNNVSETLERECGFRDQHWMELGPGRGPQAARCLAPGQWGRAAGNALEDVRRR
jgi:hypothetical protein